MLSKRCLLSLKKIKESIIPIRGLIEIGSRAKLPGSGGVGFPQYLAGAKEGLPLEITAHGCGVDKRTPPEKCAQAIRYALYLPSAQWGGGFTTSYISSRKGTVGGFKMVQEGVMLCCQA